MCPIPKVLSIKVHTYTSISLSPIKTLPYVFSPGPIHPGSHFLVIFKGAKNGVYEYVHILHFTFLFHKRQGGMLLHIVVTFLCGVGVQKGRVTFYCPDYGLVSRQEQD